MAFTLTILGSSSALPTPERFTSSQILTFKDKVFLIDCGESAQIRMNQYKVPVNKIAHVFISHLHGDHYFGLFGLLSTYNLLNRTGELNIYSFPELKKIIGVVLKNSGMELSFKINYHFLRHNSVTEIYSDNNISVSSFSLSHRMPSCGFLFREKQPLLNILKSAIEKYKIPIERIPEIKQGADFISETGEIIGCEQLTAKPRKLSSYAYCSDTKFFPELSEITRNVTVLYHEATYLDDLAEKAWQNFHSTASQAAVTAKNAGAEKLVLGHFSARYKDTDDFLKEAQNIFSNTVIAFDGLQISF